MPHALVLDGGRATVVQASAFPNERDLHDLVKDHPELLPMADLFGDGFNPSVVGYEVRLGGKYADLVLADPTGDLAIVEFKLERNEDMRQVFAQVIEYAARLWGMSYEQFDEEIVQRYFNSASCLNPRLRGKSLAEGVRELGQLSDDGWEEGFRERVKVCLARGDIKLILVVDRLDDVTRRSVEYLRAHGLSGLHAVEIRHFQESGLHVLVPTAVTSPFTGPATTAGSAPRTPRPGAGYLPWNEEALAHCVQLVSTNVRLTDQARAEFAAFVREFDAMTGELVATGLAVADFHPYSTEARSIFASMGLRAPVLGGRGVVRCACYAGDRGEGATGVSLLWQIYRLRATAAGHEQRLAQIDRLYAAVRDAITTDKDRADFIDRVERGGDPWTPLAWFTAAGRGTLLGSTRAFFAELAS